MNRQDTLSTLWRHRWLVSSLLVLVCNGCGSKATDAAPEIDSLTPATSMGPGQSYQVTARHPAGGGAIKNVWLMFSVDMTGANACWAEYSAQNQGFRLMNDQANAWREPTAPGAELSNSQCTLAPATGKGTVDGGRLVVTFPIRFSAQFTGRHTASALASTDTVHSGWKAVGTWEGP